MSELALRGGKPVYSGSWPTWPVHDEREVERVVQVVRSGVWGYNGPEEQAFCGQFAKFLGARFGLCVTNGTHALQLALEALDVGAGDEVIVPGLTWQATAAAALDINAEPVLADIEPETLCLDPKALRAAITPRTKAVIPVHLYSCMADMDAILAIADEHGLPVIEDCSHQHGSEWRGKKAGTLGAIGAFSLQASKILNAGEGGFVCTNDERLYRRLDALRNCGRPAPGVGVEEASRTPQSGNFRMTELQAALLNVGLARLEEQSARRDENAQYLSRMISEIPGLKPLLRREQVTRQAYYSYAFRYDKAALGGLSRKRFCEAVSAEINRKLGPWTYEPLNKCSLYKPQTKRRHRLSDEYWKRIDPRRFELPECTRAHEEIITCGQSFLLAGRREMERVAEALRKVGRHAEELLQEAPEAPGVPVHA